MKILEEEVSWGWPVREAYEELLRVGQKRLAGLFRSTMENRFKELPDLFLPGNVERVEFNR